MSRHTITVTLPQGPADLGAEVELLSVRCEKFSIFGAPVTDLPFTTQYGRNWKPWMAYRELESNTRDEGGQTLQVEHPASEVFGVEGMTRIVVELAEFTEAYEGRDEIFLPDAVREGTGVQIIKRPSNSIYYRGLKVCTLPSEAQQTYNFLDYMPLTEDRTLVSEYSARAALGQWLVQSDDEEVIERIVTAETGDWEREIEFNQYIAPSATFHRVMVKNLKNVSEKAHSYYAGHDSRVVSATFNAFVHHRLPWKVVGTQVLDRDGTVVFEAPYSYVGKWPLVAKAILDRLNPQAETDEEPTAEPVAEDLEVAA